MTERILRIRVRTVGQEQVTRAVRGITTSARQAARAQQQAEQQTAREAQRSARVRERAAQDEARTRTRLAVQSTRAAQQAARATAAAERQASREAQREANDLFRLRMRLRAQDTRAAQQAAREQARIARQTERSMQRRAQQIGMIGGAVFGAGRAIAGRVQGYQSALGMPTRDELVTTFLDRQRQTIRLAHQAGLSTSDLSGRIDATARRSGVSQSDLLGGLQYAQATLATPDFNALDVFSRHLDQIADASYATGAPIQDLIGALGQMRNQFGITEDDFGQMIGTMVTMANEGSIEIGDLAANFTREMGQFRNLRSGVSGVQAAREFAGTAEVIGRALPQAPEEAATQFRAVMTMLGQGRSQRGIEAGLRRGGLSRADADVFDRNGRMTVAMPELIDRMRRAHLDTPAALEGAHIRNVRAISGLQTLLREDPTTYAGLVNSSSDTGNQLITETNAELRRSDAGRIDRERANAEANFQEHGHGVVTVMTEAAIAMTELQTRAPAATEALGGLSDVLGSIGAFGLAGGVGARLLAGGGIAGALGLGGTAAAGGTGAAGVAGGAAGTGALGTVAAIAAPIAAFLGPLLWSSGVGETASGDQTAADVADSRRGASGGIDAETRDELIRQRQALSPEQGAELQRRVASGLAGGTRMHPDDIRALADAISRGVATAIPDPAAPSAIGTAPSARRVPADRR